MLKKFLKDAIGFIAGKHAEEIVDLLDSSKYLNEFIIAKKLDLTINQTRNILYKISDYSLVSSIRKKDRKKGWYTYFWRIEVLKALDFIKNDLQKKTKNLENQIRSRETKVFYFCERCNIEYTEENALIHNFVCTECGSVFGVKDNSKVLRDMRRNLDKLRSDFNFIESEIKKEMEKIGKKKMKELRKEEEVKKEKLRQKKILRDKMKKKFMKQKKQTKKSNKKLKTKIIKTIKLFKKQKKIKKSKKR